MDGYFGKYADVDLTTGMVADYAIPDAWVEKHVGGRGVATRILLEELQGCEDPLGPDNILVFATGPYQGTGTPGGGKHGIFGRSPKTNTVNESYAGGFFGHALGRSGHDGLIVRGVADSPRCIVIQDGDVDIVDATDLWGVETADVEDRLKERYGSLSVSSIGIAGENGVQSACIINDRARALGRSGWGAVMGSKRLKAIAVGGDRQKPLHDVESLRRHSAEYVKYMRSRDN
ncbi:aldehyde ferredoxin oxidoreductase, partial [Candidatus Bipolaricaulota bacterium]|nr:aldehyde ferredoxin oxidoreductase [Candidatus Bipolaricaulota bacterium]